MPAGKSNGKLNNAFPLLSVITPGTLPVFRGWLVSWLVMHCGSALKYQCTVNVVFGVLFSVPLTVIASGPKPFARPGRAIDPNEVSTGKFCCKFAPTSASSG